MKKIILLIIDGLGYTSEIKGNAPLEADMKKFKELYQKYPHCLLKASGKDVGLLENQPGNGEVGHKTIGLGKKIKQKITIINEEIENKNIYENEELNKLIEHVKTNNSTLHLMGLLTENKSHIDIEYIKKIIPILKEKEINKIIFHAITDGRDSKNMCSLRYIEEINKVLSQNNVGHIATVCGRFYAMDNESKWERTRVYADMLVNGKGLKILDVDVAVKNCYKRGLTDEFLPPLILNPEYKINEHDGLLWLNFSEESSKQILQCLTDLSFENFPIGHINNLKVVTMFSVDGLNTQSLFNIEDEKNYSLGKYFSELGMTQARIGESEKFNFISTCFDSTDEKLKFCDFYEVETPKTIEYDNIPEMNLKALINKIKKCVEKDYDFIAINIANPDMIAETGNYGAVVESLKYVDNAIDEIFEIAEDNFYNIIITSDHGNVEEMVDSNNIIKTTNTTNLVPLIFCDENVKLIEKGDLSMIAPTILKYMDIKIPESMENTPLLFERED